MIFHASIPARDPRHVAEVLAEVWGGFSGRFPVFPGSWLAVAGDDRGTSIEVYPADRVLIPGADADQPSEQVSLRPTAPASGYCAFHMAVGTPLSVERVETIGAREGWRTLRCTRGNNFFEVIEFWVENTVMLELLTPEMQARYRAHAIPANFRAMMAMVPT